MTPIWLAWISKNFETFPYISHAHKLSTISASRLFSGCLLLSTLSLLAAASRPESKESKSLQRGEHQIIPQNYIDKSGMILKRNLFLPLKPKAHFKRNNLQAVSLCVVSNVIPTLPRNTDRLWRTISLLSMQTHCNAYVFWLMLCILSKYILYILYSTWFFVYHDIMTLWVHGMVVASLTTGRWTWRLSVARLPPPLAGSPSWPSRTCPLALSSSLGPMMWCFTRRQIQYGFKKWRKVLIEYLNTTEIWNFLKHCAEELLPTSWTIMSSDLSLALRFFSCRFAWGPAWSQRCWKWSHADREILWLWHSSWCSKVGRSPRKAMAWASHALAQFGKSFLSAVRHRETCNNPTKSKFKKHGKTASAHVSTTITEDVVRVEWGNLFSHCDLIAVRFQQALNLILAAWWSSGGTVKPKKLQGHPGMRHLSNSDLSLSLSFSWTVKTFLYSYHQLPLPSIVINCNIPPCGAGATSHRRARSAPNSFVVGAGWRRPGRGTKPSAAGWAKKLVDPPIRWQILELWSWFSLHISKVTSFAMELKGRKPWSHASYTQRASPWLCEIL